VIENWKTEFSRGISGGWRNFPAVFVHFWDVKSHFCAAKNHFCAVKSHLLTEKSQFGAGRAIFDF
jgi:hypothetical protein